MQQIHTHSMSTQNRQSARPIIEVRDLTVDFETVEGRIRAIDGISFNIMPNRTLGVVGESGCGKSVTARAIMRIEDQRNCKLGGKILLSRDEESVDLLSLRFGSSTIREIRGREIGLVFQEPMTSFSPVHTIGNQIIEAVRLHFKVGKTEAESKSIAQLQSVGMPHPQHIMKQYAWELSGGLRQRAMVAMALVCNPRLLIADEPTTALDVMTQAQVLSLLSKLQAERNMGLMLITHDLGVIAEVADDVIIMYLGKIVERGPVRSIFTSPMHPYTQLLLESLPSIKRKRGGVLKTIDGSVPRALNRPAGCPFHTRCPSAMPGICNLTPPSDKEIGSGHAVSCHLYS